MRGAPPCERMPRRRWDPRAAADARRPVTREAVRIDPNGPPFVSALPEQLGLRLQSRRTALEVVVIDSADVPTPD
jgi:uncharacterized protein (TIGR03435 family)